MHDIDGFDAVLDPYFDLHLNRSVPVLASFGRYVTCGVERQFPESGTTSMAPEPVLDKTRYSPRGREERHDRRQLPGEHR